MRQLIKYFLWIGLTLGCQSAWAFALLGPVANGGDAWQVTAIGYNPLGATDLALEITDGLLAGPKNLGEGYRRNTPVMYYAFDASFADFFGSNGEFAVQQAFDLVNGAFNGRTNAPVYLYSPNNGYLGDTNTAPPVSLSAINGVDSYSVPMTEFPLNTEGQNYTASSLGLYDLKSATMIILMEQLGLADAVRYTWALHDRYQLPNTTCPNGMEYSVIQRNYGIGPSPLNQVQYSQYVNDELYNYFIIELCNAPGIQPPNAAARPIPVDPLVYNPPVSSGAGLDALLTGFYYTGLTRDDAAGLRFLYSTNNLDTPSAGYLESAATGSSLFSYSNPTLLFTSNYNALVSTAMTNDPATAAGLFPGIQFIYLTNYWSNVISSSMTFVTNFPIGAPSGQGYVGLQTNYSTNLVDFFIYSFGNVVTNKVFPTTSYRFQTITVGPPIGSPVGSAFVTNVTYSSAFQSNIASGDYFVITNGQCPPIILNALQTNVNLVTNLIAGTTNADGSSIVRNLVYFYTNYVFQVKACTLGTGTPADYQGLGRMQFIRVRDDNYDDLLQQFYIPITNQYTMVVNTNGQYITQTFQRVLTTPDFLFQASDQATGPAAPPGDQGWSRNVTFNQANIEPNLAGPGTIENPSSIILDKVGTLYENTSAFLSGPANAAQGFLWASFDGTTNAPVVYPNGTSLQNLAAESLIQISPTPPNLPGGNIGVPYSEQFSVAGANPPITWSLSPVSAGLPPGLYWDGNPSAASSSDGVISGTPTERGTFDNIIIRMTDSSAPARTVDVVYSITIN